MGTKNIIEIQDLAEEYSKEEKLNEQQERYADRVRGTHTIYLQHTPTKRLAATTRGVTVLGPKVSPSVYRTIFWACQNKRIRIVLLLFHQHLLQKETARLFYRRKRKAVWMDGQKIGYRLKCPPSRNWGSVLDGELHLLFQDIVRVKAKRSPCVVNLRG